MNLDEIKELAKQHHIKAGKTKKSDQGATTNTRF